VKVNQLPKSILAQVENTLPQKDMMATLHGGAADSFA